MSFTIDQARVIANLKRYLDWHNLPFRMNREGVCNGLAAVYAKYALQGKQEEFKRILSKITTMSIDPESDEQVNEFAKDVAQSFKPEDRPIGFLLPIGIMLSKFTDYIKESLFEHNEIKENIKNFKVGMLVQQ
ncbi:hypothetical protein BN59_03263 [Legionella massiliensis]|uniref:Uncharacterized protein n=1 Tax=Legionella massiliensis TaxID=1034943 RepID=A0A078L4W7_9GAMM|nr:hypothetical protein [Legionella massiliensis]CDZ78948.1 hypothetical protein BN59_03263 [Legionella massiliensis]CEE14686.1 hypothetical protein BN1094_03263 [Legionella massiliensis]